MTEPGVPHEDTFSPDDEHDRPLHGKTTDELLDELSRRKAAGEPFDDVQEELERLQSERTAAERANDVVLDSIDTSMLVDTAKRKDPPVPDVRAESPDDPEERRRLGREINDAKAVIRRLISQLLERIRLLADEKHQKEYFADVHRIEEEHQQYILNTGVTDPSVHNLELLYADCHETLHRLRNIQIIVDDLPTIERS